jgi:hypothetical protein
VSGTSGAGGFSCTGAALVNVDGNPLGTVAGGAGLALAAVGGIGVAGAGFAAAKEESLQWRRGVRPTLSSASHE